MAEKPTQPDPNHPVVLFDGVCNLCNRSVGFIIRRDPKARFRFAALQSDPGRRLLKARSLPLDQFDTMVLIDGSSSYTRSDAAIRIARRLSGPWPILAAARVIPRPMRNWLYDLVAGHRYRWFGRKDACMMPTEDVAHRFLQ